MLATAKAKRVRKAIMNNDDEDSAHRANVVDLDLDLVSYRDMFRCCGCCFEKRKNCMTVRIKWIPPEATSRPRNIHRKTICQPDSKSRPIKGYLRSSKGNKIKYAVRSGYDILHAEHMTGVVEHMKQEYEKDPLDPRGLSSEAPPPVRTIKAIYGINVPTEVGAIFKRRTAILGNTQKVENYCKPDMKVTLNGNDGDHVIKNGVIYECGSETVTAGDGTVPYWSLSHVKQWEKVCDVSVHELEGAEHREILADKRLHKILIDFCILKDCASDEPAKEEP